MSQYTTGDIAKLCGVTVRTVQYYDTRGILIPSALSEGGRRLYGDDDLRRLKLICFLRELELPIDSIAKLLAEENPEKVLALLMDQQAAHLSKEIAQKQEKLARLKELKNGLRSTPRISLDAIGDIAILMENKHKLQKLRWSMVLLGLPVTTLQWVSIILWITRGLWWLFPVWVAVATVYGVWCSKHYFKNVCYICPECHEKFKPTMKEAFWAPHTPTLRKLTCTSCGYHGFCIEIWGGDNKCVRSIA